METPILHLPSLVKDRSADRVEKQIERHLTQLIQSGTLAPGTRLPSNTELAASWSTSCSSVQRALAAMRAAGLIDRATSRGTFVRSRQQRATIGILFGPNLIDNTAWYSRTLWEHLSNEIDSEFLTSRVYSGLATHQDPKRGESQLEHLAFDLQYGSFAGIIRIDTIQAPHIPGIADLPSVIFNNPESPTDLVHESETPTHAIYSSIQRKGLRNVTIFSSRSNDIISSSSTLDSLLQEAPRYDINATLLEHTFTKGRFAREESAHNAILNHFGPLPPKQRPEALIIIDDVTASAAIMALFKLGIRIPDDLVLYITTSEEAAHYYSVPVNRYCRPIRKTAKCLVELLKAKIAGESPSIPIVLQGWMVEEE